MRVKTAHGVVAMTRPTKKSWARVKFEVDLKATDAPSVVWIAEVELAGQVGESAPKATRVQRR
jgi:hypothetical protein